MKSNKYIPIFVILILILFCACEKDSIVLHDNKSDIENRAKKPKPPPEPEPIITIQDLGTIGGIASVAYGINIVNDDIWVVGYSYLPSGSGAMTHPFLWKLSSGIMEDIGPDLEGIWIEATDVNSSGAIVGSSQHDETGYTEALLWQEDGTIVNLGDLTNSSCQESEAKAINSNEVVAGYATPESTCTNHAWTWALPDQLVDLGTMENEAASALGINSDGAIAGWVLVSLPTYNKRAVWSYSGQAGDMEILNGLEDIYSEATDINDNNQIVGTLNLWVDPVPFLWENNSYIELPTLGGEAYAWAISNDGYVTGESRLKKKGSSNPTHAYLWHNDIGTIDLGCLTDEKLALSMGYDVIEHPTEPNVILVAGWSENRAVLWTVDLSPLL